MAERYYLIPGKSIGKKGLPAGKLECGKGKDPLEIKPKLVEVIKKNLGYFVSQGTIVTGTVLDELAEKAVTEAEEKKASEDANKKAVSDKMQALIEHAESLGLEVPEKISQKDLKKLIQDKGEEAKLMKEKISDLMKQAEELKLEGPEGISLSVEELETLITEELEK